MGVGPFSSESTTKKSTTDNRIAVSDQGVVQVNRVAKGGKLNSPNNSVTVKKGGTLTQVTNTTSSVDVTSLGDAVTKSLSGPLGQLAAQLAANKAPEPLTNDPVTNAVDDSLASHIADNATASTDNVQAGLPSTVTHWILYGLAAVALFALVFLLKGKRA